MSYLIFCSYEVGGQPYRIADILNRHGVKTYYVSLSLRTGIHDSTVFHFGQRSDDWDLSNLFQGNYLTYNLRKRNIAKGLAALHEQHGITNCFATGSLSYLLKEAGIPYKYWSYGSDIDRCCDLRMMAPWKMAVHEKAIRYGYYLLFGCPQLKKALANADAVMIAPYQFEGLTKLLPNKSLFFLPHFIRVTDYERLVAEKRKNREIICSMIDAERFFFSPTRHVWSGHFQHIPDNKGNDIVIKAFARYAHVSGDTRSKLVLVSKGPDARTSKRLIEDLGVERLVIWLDEMKRDELNRYYQATTVCFGQFGTPVITGSVVEPLATATTCISYLGERSGQVPTYAEAPPVVNSRNPEAIAQAMSRLVSDKTYRSELSHRSWCWAKDHCSEERFVEEFLKVFVTRSV